MAVSSRQVFVVLLVLTTACSVLSGSWEVRSEPTELGYKVGSKLIASTASVTKPGPVIRNVAPLATPLIAPQKLPFFPGVPSWVRVWLRAIKIMKRIKESIKKQPAPT